MIKKRPSTAAGTSNDRKSAAPMNNALIRKTRDGTAKVKDATATERVEDDEVCLSTFHLNSHSQEDIILHVFDESRNAKRDFHCKKGILKKEMSYFNRILDAKSSIEVHSDLEVFEQLMGYCFNKEIHLGRI